MVILTMAERDLPLLQFFSPLSVELQAAVTGSADIISEDIAHMVQHANHTGRYGFGWWGNVLRCWWSAASREWS